jgi:transcription antitermination factor NusG
MDKQWYVIRTHVGDGQRVKAALQQKIRECGQGRGLWRGRGTERRKLGSTSRKQKWGNNEFRRDVLVSSLR